MRRLGKNASVFNKFFHYILSLTIWVKSKLKNVYEYVCEYCSLKVLGIQNIEGHLFMSRFQWLKNKQKKFPDFDTTVYVINKKKGLI